MAGDACAFVNLVACRPCDQRGGPNRDPNAHELYSCRPRLLAMVRALAPHGLVLLGKLVQEEMKHSMAKWCMRCPCCLLVHPAYLVRKGGSVRSSSEYWNAVQTISGFWQQTFTER